MGLTNNLLFLKIIISWIPSKKKSSRALMRRNGDEVVIIIRILISVYLGEFSYQI